MDVDHLVGRALKTEDPREGFPVAPILAKQGKGDKTLAELGYKGPTNGQPARYQELAEGAHCGNCEYYQASSGAVGLCWLARNSLTDTPPAGVHVLGVCREWERE